MVPTPLQPPRAAAAGGGCCCRQGASHTHLRSLAAPVKAPHPRACARLHAPAVAGGDAAWQQAKHLVFGGLRTAVGAAASLHAHASAWEQAGRQMLQGCVLQRPAAAPAPPSTQVPCVTPAATSASCTGAAHLQVNWLRRAICCEAACAADEREECKRAACTHSTRAGVGAAAAQGWVFAMRGCSVAAAAVLGQQGCGCGAGRAPSPLSSKRSTMPTYLQPQCAVHWGR